MLDQTFIHVPGVGRKTECELWQLGIRSWSEFTDFFTRPSSIPPGLRRKLQHYIHFSHASLRSEKRGDCFRNSGEIAFT